MCVTAARGYAAPGREARPWGCPAAGAAGSRARMPAAACRVRQAPPLHPARTAPSRARRLIPVLSAHDHVGNPRHRNPRHLRSCTSASSAESVLKVRLAAQLD